MKVLQVLLLLVLFSLSIFVFVNVFYTPDILVCEETQYINSKGECTECPWLYTCDGQEYRVPDPIAMFSEATSLDLSKWGAPSVTDMQSMIRKSRVYARSVTDMQIMPREATSPFLTSFYGAMTHIYTGLNPNPKP